MDAHLKGRSLGYDTTFDGHINIDPPLNAAEISYINDFSGSRRMKRTGGPYVADPGDDFGQYGGISGRGRQPKDEIIEFNDPPQGQPGLWCQWEATADGRALVWDGGEKFYDAPEWMAYLIDHFLKPGAVVQDNVLQEERFELFSFNHVLDGTIEAQGEDPDDRWKLIVKDNEVLVSRGEVSYTDPRPVQ